MSGTPAGPGRDPGRPAGSSGDATAAEASASTTGPGAGRSTAVQALKFTLLSLSAGVIEAVCFVLLEQLGALPYEWNHVISITLSVLWNFTLNRRYTFKSANNVPVAMLKVAAFYVVFIPLTAWLGQLAANAGINEYAIKGITMVLNFALEFLWWKFVVFRGSENTNELATRARPPRS